MTLRPTSFSRVQRWTVSTVIGAILCVAAGVGSAQPWTGTSTGEGNPLARQVTIYRDRYGIPHVVGETDEAMYFGFGYASAEDHLDRLLMNYRLGAGRAAEIVGEPRFLSDYHARLFRLRQMAVERSYEIDSELRSVLDPYVRGINYYMERHRELLPPWAEPVWPADVIGFHRYVTMFEFALAQYGVFGQPSPLPTGTLLALQPGRTSENVPTLLVTCQARFDGPLTLYEAHLSSEDGTDLYGATFPGLPAMYVGCNRDIAWGFTPNAPDVADTLMFRLRSLSPLLYTYMDRPFACWVEPTQLGIGGSPAGPGQIVSRELAYSHAGPVVRIAEMTAEVLTMAGWRDINGLGQWLRVNRARSVGDFRTALAEMQVPSLNAVCADRRGRIFYAYCAKSPRKSDQIDWRFPVDGNRIETEWMGWLPFEKLPQISDPPTGFVQSANGVPWRATGQSLLDPTDFPPYLVEDFESVRTDRILEIMQARQVLSLDIIKNLAWDTVVPFAYDAVQMLTAAHRSGWREYENAQGSILFAVQMLQKWDRRVAPDSMEAALFAAWWREYRAMFPQMPDIGLVRALTGPGPQQAAASMQALKRAVNFMMERYGRLDVPWGEVRRIRYEQHEFPVGGSAALHTVHQTAPEPRPSWAVEFVGSGDVYKMIVQLRETPDVYSVTPFGNSSAPASPHVVDQMELYSNQQFKFVDLAGATRGRDVESAWGTRARFELDGGNSEFELSVPMPVTAQVSILDPADVAPPLPRSARSVGPVVQLGTVPYSEGCQWTFTTRVPEDVLALRADGYVPVGVIESLPYQWIPLPAQWRDDGTALIVEGRGQGAIAVYLVPPQEKSPNAQ